MLLNNNSFLKYFIIIIIIIIIIIFGTLQTPYNVALKLSDVDECLEE